MEETIWRDDDMKKRDGMVGERSNGAERSDHNQQKSAAVLVPRQEGLISSSLSGEEASSSWHGRDGHVGRNGKDTTCRLKTDNIVVRPGDGSERMVEALVREEGSQPLTHVDRFERFACLAGVQPLQSVDGNLKDPDSYNMMVVICTDEARGVGFGREDEKDGVGVKIAKEDVLGLGRQKGGLSESEQTGNKDFMLKEQDMRSKGLQDLVSSRNVGSGRVGLDGVMHTGDDAFSGQTRDVEHEKPSSTGPHGVSHRDEVNWVAQKGALDNRLTVDANVRLVTSKETTNRAGMDEELVSQREGSLGTGQQASIAVEDGGELNAECCTDEYKHCRTECQGPKEMEKDEDGSPGCLIHGGAVSSTGVMIKRGGIVIEAGGGTVLPHNSEISSSSIGIQDGSFLLAPNSSSNDGGRNDAVADAVDSRALIGHRQSEVEKVMVNGLIDANQEAKTTMPSGFQGNIFVGPKSSCRVGVAEGEDEALLCALATKEPNSQAGGKGDNRGEEPPSSRLKHSDSGRECATSIGAMDGSNTDNHDGGNAGQALGNGDGDETAKVVALSAKLNACSRLRNGFDVDGSAQLNSVGCIDSKSKGADLGKYDAVAECCGSQTKRNSANCDEGEGRDSLVRNGVSDHDRGCMNVTLRTVVVKDKLTDNMAGENEIELDVERKVWRKVDSGAGHQRSGKRGWSAVEYDSNNIKNGETLDSKPTIENDPREECMCVLAKCNEGVQRGGEVGKVVSMDPAMLLSCPNIDGSDSRGLGEGQCPSAEEVEQVCDAAAGVVTCEYRGATPSVSLSTEKGGHISPGSRAAAEKDRGNENLASWVGMVNGGEGSGHLGKDHSEVANGGAPEQSEPMGSVCGKAAVFELINEAHIVLQKEEDVENARSMKFEFRGEEQSSVVSSGVECRVCISNTKKEDSDHNLSAAKISCATAMALDDRKKCASGSRQQLEEVGGTANLVQLLPAGLYNVNVDVAIEREKGQDDRHGLSGGVLPKGGMEKAGACSTRVQQASSIVRDISGPPPLGAELARDSLLTPLGISSDVAAKLPIPAERGVPAEGVTLQSPKDGVLTDNLSVSVSNPMLLQCLLSTSLLPTEGGSKARITTGIGVGVVGKIAQPVGNKATVTPVAATIQDAGKHQEKSALNRPVPVDEPGLSVPMVVPGTIPPSCVTALPDSSATDPASCVDRESMPAVDLVLTPGIPASSAGLLLPCVNDLQTATSLARGRDLDGSVDGVREEDNQEARALKAGGTMAGKSEAGLGSEGGGAQGVEEEPLTCLPQGPVLVSMAGVVHPLTRCESLGVMNDLNQDLTSLLRPEADLTQNDSFLMYFDQSEAGPDTDVLTLPNGGTGTNNPCPPSAVSVDGNALGASAWHGDSSQSTQQMTPGIPVGTGRAMPPIVAERDERMSAGRRLLGGSKHGAEGSSSSVPGLTQLVPKLVQGRQSSIILRPPPHVYNLAATNKGAFSGMIPTPGFNPSLSGPGASEEILPEPKPHLTLHVVPHLSSNLFQGLQSSSQTVRATGHPLSPFPNASAIMEARGASCSMLKTPKTVVTPPADAGNRITGKAAARRSVLSLKVRASAEPTNSTQRLLPQSLSSKGGHQERGGGDKEGMCTGSSSPATQSKTTASFGPSEQLLSKASATVRVGTPHVSLKNPTASNTRAPPNHPDGQHRHPVMQTPASPCDASATDVKEHELDPQEAAREAKAKELAQAAAKARQRARQATKIASEKASLAVAATARAATAVKRAAELLCQTVPASSPLHLRTRMNSILGTAERLTRKRKAGEVRTDETGECSGSVVTVAAADDVCGGGDAKRRSTGDAKFRQDKECKAMRALDRTPAADPLTGSVAQEGRTERKPEVHQPGVGNTAPAFKTSASSQQLSFLLERKWSNTARRGRKPIRAADPNSQDMAIHRCDRQNRDTVTCGVNASASVSDKEAVAPHRRGGVRDPRRARLRGKARGWSHRKKYSSTGRGKKQQMVKPCKMDKAGFSATFEEEIDNLSPSQLLNTTSDPESASHDKQAGIASCKARTIVACGGGLDWGNRGADQMERHSEDESMGGERTAPKRLAMIEKTAAWKRCVVDTKISALEGSASEMAVDGVDGAVVFPAGIMKKYSERTGRDGSEAGKATTIASMVCVRREARSKRSSRARRVTNNLMANDAARGNARSAELRCKPAGMAMHQSMERINEGLRSNGEQVEGPRKFSENSTKYRGGVNATEGAGVVDDRACGRAPPLKVYFRRKAVKMEVRFEDGYEQLESEARDRCEAVSWVRSVRNLNRSVVESGDEVPPVEIGGCRGGGCTRRPSPATRGQDAQEENGRAALDADRLTLGSGEGWHAKSTKVRRRSKADGTSSHSPTATRGPSDTVLAGFPHEQAMLPPATRTIAVAKESQHEVCRSNCFVAGKVKSESSPLLDIGQEGRQHKHRFKQGELDDLMNRGEAERGNEEGKETVTEGKGRSQMTTVNVILAQECDDGLSDLGVDLTCREEVEGVNTEGVLGSSSLEVSGEGERTWNGDADGGTGRPEVDPNGLQRERDEEPQEHHGQVERYIEVEVCGGDDSLRRKRAQRWNSLKELLQQKFHSRPRKKHKLDGIMPPQSEQCVGIGAMKQLPQCGHARKR